MNGDWWEEEREWMDRLERITGIYVAVALVGALLLVALAGWIAQ